MVLKAVSNNRWFVGKDFLIEALKYHLMKLEQRTTVKTARTTPRQAQKQKVSLMFLDRSV